MWRRGLLFSLISLLWASEAQAQSNVTCNNGNDITSALNTAISAAATGATIGISAGSCSMSPVTITDKNITIMGAGKGQTNITANNGFGTINVSGANV